MYCVYKHTAPNNKVYIGITSRDPLIRWNKGHGYQRNKHFYNAILKYGWDNIKHEILCEGLSKEEACKKEIELIDKYKSNQREFGYNKSIGGEINRGWSFNHSENYKKQVSLRMRGNKNIGDQRGCNNNFYGHHHTDKAKRKISESQYHPVIQYDKEGNFIAKYSNPYQAELQTGILHIRECAIGNRRSAGGYVWRYAEW